MRGLYGQNVRFAIKMGIMRHQRKLIGDQGANKNSNSWLHIMYIFFLAYLILNLRNPKFTAYSHSGPFPCKKIKYYKLSNFRPNLRDSNQYFSKLGPSASLWAISMCLRPQLDNGNNTPASLEALGCASGHSLCSCIIT